MRRTGSLALLLLLATGASAQEAATTFKSTEIAAGIYMIEGADGFAGGNMGLLVGEDHIAMIDDGLEPSAPQLLEFVEQVAGGPITFVVNTHVHGDHAGGNAHFAENDAIVVAHENIRQRLLADAGPAGGPAGLPVMTFTDSVSFHLNGIEAHVHHVPGAHTDGDAFIVFPDVDVIHAGDVWFHDRFPYIDLDNGGTLDGYIAAQRKIIEMAGQDTTIVPGHGPLGSRADMEANLSMLIDAQAAVRQLLDEGLSEDEIVAANPLAEFHDKYDWAFITTERMTRTLVRGLQSEGS